MTEKIYCLRYDIPDGRFICIDIIFFFFTAVCVCGWLASRHAPQRFRCVVSARILGVSSHCHIRKKGVKIADILGVDQWWYVVSMLTNMLINQIVDIF